MNTPITGVGIGIDRRAIPGPVTVAGSGLAQSLLNQLDDKTRLQVGKALAGLLPGSPIAAGSAAGDRQINPDVLAKLVQSAAIVAAGLDPATATVPVPGVLWRSGAQQLLIQPSGVGVTLGDGLIALTIPVTCDQTKDTTVSVTFVTGTPSQPAGGVMTAEDHPRGDEVIVENWAEPLIAYAWQTIVLATSALSDVGGTDTAGRGLITAAVTATANGLTVTPMGRNIFLPDGLAR